MDAASTNEKMPPTPQSDVPVTDTNQLTVARFRKQSGFGKLWVSAHGLAVAFSLCAAVGSAGLYFASEARDCDNYSPFSRALLSGLAAFFLSLYAWFYSYRLRRLAKTLNGSNTWSPQARQRRRQRIPIFFALMAVFQYLAALAQGSIAYRTSREPLGLGFLNILAAIGMAVSLIAGSCNMWLASSVRHPRSTDTTGQTLDQKVTRDVTEESTLLYDTDFTSLPTFDKQWLAAHVFAVIAIASTQATILILLALTPCAHNTRKPLMKLSEDTFSATIQMVNMSQFIFNLWVARIQPRAANKNLSRVIAIFAQFYPLATGSCLGIAAWVAPHSTYSLAAVKYQVALASAACIVCSGYNFALMLKTNFNPPPSDAAAAEKDIRQQSEDASRQRSILADAQEEL